MKSYRKRNTKLAERVIELEKTGGKIDYSLTGLIQSAWPER